MEQHHSESMPFPPAPLVELRDVHHTYRAGLLQTHALAGVSLAVRPGEWVAVTGPSGSGKSTLLAVLGLLERPTSGSCLFQGVDAGALSSDRLARLRRGRIGYVFQSIHLAARLSVEANLELALAGLGLDAAERARRIEEALGLVDLTGRRRHRPAELSGGQQQRVALARALAIRPALLLADEPTGNLDSATSGKILDLLQSLHAAGTTIVLVTHDPAIAARAPRAIEMLDGRIVAERLHAHQS
jgi:putative ABC transport system ATP-binding protein